MWLLNFLFLLLHTQNVFEPPHLKEIAPVKQNVNVIAGTWVIGDLEVATDGGVKSAIPLTANDPLRSDILAGASRWKFTPANAGAPVDSHVMAVFLFRPRDIFASPAPSLSGGSGAELNRPPIPVNVSDPGYMPTSVAEGEVVLELRVSENGDIQDVRPFRGIAGLTEYTERAVRSWKFVPALRNGLPVPGTVIAVVSYLRPVV